MAKHRTPIKGDIMVETGDSEGMVTRLGFTNMVHAEEYVSSTLGQGFGFDERTFSIAKISIHNGTDWVFDSEQEY